MRVMVLDDEPNIVKGLAYMIDRFGIPHCEVVPKTDPLEAIESLREKAADLVIADINMPGMSGLVFIEEAQKIRPSRFVILSGYSDFSYAQKAIHLQVHEYLIKPVDEEVLRKMISSVFKEMYCTTPEEYMEMSSFFSPGLFSRNRKFSAHMETILNFIQENFSTDVSITRLSDATGLHPNYISSLFAREMNMGLHKYVQSLKLMKAMQMLRNNPEMTIAKIAATLGYFNERQFFRMFKECTGKTPGRFREEGKG
ncbi:MAG: helix-turn-helix domain-containing protein [Treponema sp.]|jgi:YesN/AraC family two-component response regulator|nr:helix-turn-helix domain-containing protein [Treponema sp.]